MIGTRTWGEGGRIAPAGPGDPAAIDDAALIRDGLTGDPRALERLLAAHRRSLYALCRGVLGNPDDAEDALQETFLRALGGLSRFRGDAAFRTWIVRIALHVCLKWRARRPRTVTWSVADDLGDSGAPDSEAIAVRNLRVAEALRELLPRHRAVLLLKEVEGWSIVEIGHAFGWNPKRVQNELYKARRALADWRRRECPEGVES